MRFPTWAFAVAGVLLALFGAWRLRLGLGHDPGPLRRRHLVFGAFYVLAGLFVVLSAAGVIPNPGIRPG